MLNRFHKTPIVRIEAFSPFDLLLVNSIIEDRGQMIQEPPSARVMTLVSNCLVDTGIARHTKNRVMNIIAWKVNVIAGTLPLSFGLDFGRPRHMRHETIFSKRCEKTGGRCSF